MDSKSQDLISRSGARILGLRHYFTGKFCKNGHIDIRFVSSGTCRSCDLEKTKRYQHSHRAMRSEYERSWYQKNKIKKLSMARVWRQENKASKAALNAKWRARRKQASPKWLTAEDLYQIRALYEAAASMKTLTDIEYQVDHVIPLQNKYVCGLHVPWNLQVITKKENNRKRNRFKV